MQQALALGVPTGLFCAVVLARQFKACKHELATSKQELEAIHTELEAMQTKHMQEIAVLTARHEKEIADLTARHEQEIADNKQELASMEYDRSAEEVNLAWFKNRSDIQEQALNLFMEIMRPTKTLQGAAYAWVLGEMTFILLHLWEEAHPHNMDISTDLLAAKKNRELRDTTTVDKKDPQISGYDLMQELHTLNTCLSDKSAAPEKVLPLVAALVAYTLECFKHFFLLLPPDMTEKIVLGQIIPSDQQQTQMLYAWTNYFDPSP